MKTKCSTCDGDGYILVLTYNGWIMHDHVVRWECKDCDGTGEIEVWTKQELEAAEKRAVELLKLLEGDDENE